MKKKWKLILILAIVAALLFAAGAYIIVFRTNLTVDFYMSQGTSAFEAGKYSSAIRYLSVAMNLDDSQSQIPITLAKAYKNVGNYTKAEYTLVSAITNHPEMTELYVALSHTYVEQEKFLDADLMLSRAANEAVKAELTAMRPAAPTLTPESGFYSTYITVSATCPAGRIFLTTDGAYPSSKDDLYTEPVTLPSGETTVCALVVDDSGLVSPVTFAGYTISGVIEPVTITDPALDALLRETIGKAPEDELISNELWNIEELEIPAAVTDLSQLKYLTGLKKLKLSNVSTADISVITCLPALAELDLSGCILSTTALEVIGKLPELTSLNLSGCAIRNIQPLSCLVKLTSLDLSNNVIDDITPLAELTELTNLSLTNNPITSLAPLEACKNLETLNVSSCEITSLDALAKLKKLANLEAADNAIASIGALENCKSLTKLNVSSNDLTDISVLSNLTSLTVFDGSYNEITAIPGFEASHPLQHINLNYNSITSVSGLAGLISLNYVLVEYNSIADLTSLAGCYKLVQVDAWGNPITAGVSELQEHSIIVNYNPN